MYMTDADIERSGCSSLSGGIRHDLSELNNGRCQCNATWRPSAFNIILHSPRLFNQAADPPLPPDCVLNICPEAKGDGRCVGVPWIPSHLAHALASRPDRRLRTIHL